MIGRVYSHRTTHLTRRPRHHEVRRWLCRSKNLGAGRPDRCGGARGRTGHERHEFAGQLRDCVYRADRAVYRHRTADTRRRPRHHQVRKRLRPSKDRRAGGPARRREARRLGTVDQIGLDCGLRCRHAGRLSTPEQVRGTRSDRGRYSRCLNVLEKSSLD